jgi:tetratricopeptide (TPR) repeat protein
MRAPIAIAVWAMWAAVSAAAPQAAANDLSEASPAELRAIVARPADGGAEGALRRAEAQYRLGDLTGDAALIRAGAAEAGRVLASLEAGGRGALWVAANKHVGTALVMLARRSGDRTRLDEAIAAFESAALFARDSVPEQWPGLMNSLAIAQWTKGSLARDPVAVRQAADSFRKALEDTRTPPGDRDRVRIQTNLGSTLIELSNMTGDAAALDEAIRRYQEALALVGREKLAAQEAILRGNLAQALTVRGYTRRSVEDLERSVALARAAIDYWRGVGAADALAEAEANLRETHRLLAELYDGR